MNKDLWLASVFTLVLFVLDPDPTLAQAASEAQLTMVADHMHEHLTRISTIKAAIVAGDLEAVIEPAIWLADHETVAGLPPNFESYVTQMKRFAQQVVEAKDLDTVAMAVSSMAKTCGNCHLVNEVELEFGFDQSPREDVEDIVAHMQRHQWAADRLWEGLIGPSDTAWNRGADMLIDVPLESEDVTIATENIATVGNITRRIHALGSIGTETNTPDARSKVYGEILGLCAACHVLLERGPSR